MTRVGLMLIPIAGAAVAGALLLGGHQADQAGPRWRAILEPVAGQSTRGGAMVEARGDESTRFTITIRNAPENATLAWHLHSGTCAAPGDVVVRGILNCGLAPEVPPRRPSPWRFRRPAQAITSYRSTGRTTR